MFLNPEVSLQVIADSVMKLSDFFIDHPDQQTPWSEKYCQIAYRYYYLPLNYIRNIGVIERGQKVQFFKNLNTTIDWGAGPGTASLALSQQLNLQSQILIEKEKMALDLFQDLNSHLTKPEKTTRLSLENLKINPDKSLLVFSYSITEMKQLPTGWKNFEALMILEPATQQDGRRLMNFRTELVENGYTIWAPCTHHHNCPLLTHSKVDWCHDRFHVKAPEWFLKLESLLPLKNKTVTTSYILARKSKDLVLPPNPARLVGDSMEEKGKTRQLICKGTEREFLTWMHKNIEPETLPRGELVTLHDEIELKSNEIRLKKHLK